MSRHISFALTTRQFIAGSKTVTRRLGWNNLKPGDVLCAVKKSQGLKKGETVRRLGMIRVLSVRREPIRAMTNDEAYGEDEVCKEGFPAYAPGGFVTMFCEHNRCTPDTEITRIEFERLP